MSPFSQKSIGLLFLILLAALFLRLQPAQVSAMAHSNSAQASSLSYPIVDPGQSKCYNNTTEITCPIAGAAFYGQDAQNITHVANYTLNNLYATVTDNITGLTWERSPDTNGDGFLNKADKLTYSAALARCAGYNSVITKGYQDWRLPTIKELYSLIDFRGTDPSGFSGTDTSGLTPFIDTTYFQFGYGLSSDGERVIDSQYASSTLYAASTNKLFGVNFADGRIKGYDLTTPSGSEKTFFVQCVRGNTTFGLNIFADNGDGTITDSATGLMWAQKDSAAGMDWKSALAWVQQKNAENTLGHNDWRLPDAKEMQSIVDYTRSPDTTHSAAIDPIFNTTSITNENGQLDWPWFWTSTTHATYSGMGETAGYVAFGRAAGWMKASPSATCYTFTDIHGAGAQRSDPKQGSASNYPLGSSCSGGSVYGRGPQGDTLHINNYVRLVRTVESESPRGNSIFLPLIANH
jgi:hypothetical protein